MMNPVRKELLEILAELSEAAPDVRFGQLITNLAYLSRGLSQDAAWEVEDAQLLSAARQHSSDMETTGATVTPSQTT
jgi:hypothetical protein